MLGSPVCIPFATEQLSHHEQVVRALRVAMQPYVFQPNTPASQQALRRRVDAALQQFAGRPGQPTVEVIAHDGERLTVRVTSNWLMSFTLTGRVTHDNQT